MTRKALVINNRVQEIFDPAPPLHPNIEANLVECDASVDITQYYFNGVFVDGPDNAIRKPVWNGSAWESSETQQEIDKRNNRNATKEKLKNAKKNKVKNLGEIKIAVEAILEHLEQRGDFDG